MGSIKAALKGARGRLSSRRSARSGDKAERAQRRAQAEAVRVEHKRYTNLGGGGGGADGRPPV